MRESGRRAAIAAGESFVVVMQVAPTGPLSGVRIIDLTSIYSGPICASILGDQGADVIKVGVPGGDLMRVATCSPGSIPQARLGKSA